MRLALLIVTIILIFGCTRLAQNNTTEGTQEITPIDQSQIVINQPNCTTLNSTYETEISYVFESYVICNGTVVANNTQKIAKVIDGDTENGYTADTIQNDSILEDIDRFKEWAKNHSIELVGVNKSVNEFYYNGSKEGDFLLIDDVPNAIETANGLYKIPEHLLKVMNGKTIYLSHKNGRGYTVLGSWPEQGIMVGMNRGIIIEQKLNEQQTVHEFGHVLDYHGIRGMYEDKEDYWKELEEKRNETFTVPFSYDPDLASPPAGYMDVYSTANDAENFAQHFAFYILNGKEFREKSQNDTLLKKKYDFFKNELFNEIEYE